MSADLSEFHATFFEESTEAIDAMESGLLDLDLSAPDAETINNIFRGAHSMKGGAGMFGFTELAGFTHTIETLLDEVRDGSRHLTEAARDLLLRSVDSLRGIVDCLQQGAAVDAAIYQQSQAELDAELANKNHAAAAADSPDPAPGGAGGHWCIEFKPYLNMLENGNEPARIFRELAEYGELQVEVNTESVPEFEALVPEQCYLSWSLVLEGEVDRHAIDEAFAWVDGECELVIERVEAAAGDEDDVEQTTSTQQSATPETRAPTPTADSNPGAQSKPTVANAGNRAASGDSSIRVGIEKVDVLINLVGELVITQSMLSRYGEGAVAGELEDLRSGLAQLERNTRELQETVMQIRMLPIKFSFSRFPRLVRDLSNKLGKQVDLKMLGEQTELDKTVLEKIADPLVHIVRNSLDHGIETPEVRRAAGKPETGTLTLNAFHAGGNIVIEVSDDGAGINHERLLEKALANNLIKDRAELSDDQINNLIFHPGLSTAKEISDVSGRGVGMDVVRRNIKDLGGTVEIQSRQGVGSTLTIRLPLTLAILDGQLVQVGKEIYIIPLISIIESIQSQPELTSAIAGRAELYRVRDEYIPVVHLHELFGVSGAVEDVASGLLVVVEADGRRIGLLVDDLLGQQQVVIKSLEENYRQIEGLSGATILGDGTVALILDVPGLMRAAAVAEVSPAAA